MTGLVLAALLAQSVAAPLPADAPTASVVKAGETVPFDGLLVSDLQAVAQARRVISCETERDELKKGGLSTLAIILVAVGAFVLGGAAGVGIAKAVK